MAAAALTRDLPALHQDGTIKFRVVLGMARAERRFRRQADRCERTPCHGMSCLVHRFDRVRADMESVRSRIAHDRAFWPVENRPVHRYERVRRAYFGHVWDEAVYAGDVAEIEAEPVDQREAA